MDPSLAPFLANVMRLIFSVQPNDIPVCQTRIMRKGRGWPWSHRLGVHPLKDGRLEITQIP
jgi:hypothetical protein